MESRSPDEPRPASRVSIRDADLVLTACAIRAGAHAALVPAHLQREPRLGLAFLAALGLLLAVGAAIARSPASARPVRAAALLFALTFNQAVGGHRSPDMRR
jgi:hypothetical protein